MHLLAKLCLSQSPDSEAELWMKQSFGNNRSVGIPLWVAGSGDKKTKEPGISREECATPRLRENGCDFVKTRNSDTDKIAQSKIYWPVQL